MSSYIYIIDINCISRYVVIWEDIVFDILVVSSLFCIESVTITIVMMLVVIGVIRDVGSKWAKCSGGITGHIVLLFSLVVLFLILFYIVFHGEYLLGLFVLMFISIVYSHYLSTSTQINLYSIIIIIYLGCYVHGGGCSIVCIVGWIVDLVCILFPVILFTLG